MIQNPGGSSLTKVLTRDCLSLVYSVQWSMHYTVYNVQYNVHFTVYTLQCTVQCTLVIPTSLWLDHEPNKGTY